MKFKAYFLILLFGLILSTACVNAVDINGTDNMGSDFNESGADYVSVPNSHNSYYVDSNEGDDSNDGLSWSSSLKSFNKALDLAHDNDDIYLSNGVYSQLDNTKITISKSVNVIGSSNTTFDGLYTNYIFIIADDVNVSFKNINFINAYKIERDYDLIEDYGLEGVYGSALDIKNAKVTLDGCSFIYNMANFEGKKFKLIKSNKLSEKNNIYHSMFKNDINSVLLVDGYTNNGKILYAIPNFPFLYRFNGKEIINTPIEELLPNVIQPFHKDLTDMYNINMGKYYYMGFPDHDIVYYDFE